MIVKPFMMYLFSMKCTNRGLYNKIARPHIGFSNKLAPMSIYCIPKSYFKSVDAMMRVECELQKCCSLLDHLSSFIVGMENYEIFSAYD
jgi:hypothetical protein